MKRSVSLVRTIGWMLSCFVLVLCLTIPAMAETLTVWVGDGTVRLAEYQVVADLFEKQNPGLKVDLQLQSGSQAQIMDKLMLAIAAGAPPDVTWFEGSAVIEFAAQGLLTEVTNAVRGLKFTPADVVEMTYAGKMWAVPYHTAVRGLFKNVDIFEEVGLNPNIDPVSLDEMYEWNKKMVKQNPDGSYSRAGMVPWVGNWGAPAWIWTFGGELIETVGDVIRPTATNPKNIEAFRWIRTWAQFYGTSSPVAAGWTGLANGTVGMTPGSSSEVARILEAGTSFTTGRVPHPPGGRNGTWGGGTAVAVPAGVKNVDLALKLARFFGETEVQIQRFLSPAGVVLPANWDALMTVGRQLDQRLWGPLLDQFPEARPRTPLWIEYYVNQLNPAMNAVVNGSKTPEKALEDVQLVMQERFADIFGK